MLELTKVNAFHGLNHVLRDVSMRVNQGEIVSLLGRNGAGKTTTIETIAGLIKPSAGSIRMGEHLLSTMHSFAICKSGVGWVPQGRRLFPELTVNDNIRLAVLKMPSTERASGLQKAYDMFPVLAQRMTTLASNLSGGEQQMLAISRAVIGEPRLVLMDEPSEGLSPAMVAELAVVIKSVAAQGVAVLLAEQNIHMALAIASRHYILDKGQVCYSTQTDELNRRPDVLLNFLGVSTKSFVPVS
ncbi:MAG: ABC transporter ATP-binding protein [Burkholderiales bacterium]|nr:ABC transporter ATP-binding protein [Burkholderiales bacterium]